MKINRRIFKKIIIIIGEWPYFLGNVLVGVRVVFLLDCPLILSLLKHKGVGAFFNKKNEESNQGKPLK